MPSVPRSRSRSDVTATAPFLEGILAELELSARLGLPLPRPILPEKGGIRHLGGDFDFPDYPRIITGALKPVCRLARGEIAPGEFAEWVQSWLGSIADGADSGLTAVQLEAHRAAVRADLALTAQKVESGEQSQSSRGFPVEDLGELVPLEGPSDVLDPYASGPPFGWVLIAGLGSPTLPPLVALAAQAVGATIAATGFGLIAGGWQGVDQQTTLTFLHRLQMDRREPRDWLRILMEPGRRPAVDHPDIEVAESVSDSIQRSVAAADAVVLLSGRGGTARIGRAALQQGVPVLAFKASGGDAEAMFEDCREGFSQWAPSGVQSAWDRLDAPLPESLFALPSLLMHIGEDHLLRPDWRPPIPTAKPASRRAPVRKKGAGPIRRPK